MTALSPPGCFAAYDLFGRCLFGGTQTEIMFISPVVEPEGCVWTIGLSGSNLYVPRNARHAPPRMIQSRPRGRKSCWTESPPVPSPSVQKPMNKASDFTEHMKSMEILDVGLHPPILVLFLEGRGTQHLTDPTCGPKI